MAFKEERIEVDDFGVIVKSINHGLSRDAKGKGS